MAFYELKKILSNNGNISSYFELISRVINNNLQNVYTEWNILIKCTPFIRDWKSIRANVTIQFVLLLFNT